MANCFKQFPWCRNSAQALELQEIYTIDWDHSLEWKTPFHGNFLNSSDDVSIPPHVLLWYHQGDKIEVRNGQVVPKGTAELSFQKQVQSFFARKFSGPQAHCALEISYAAFLFMAGFLAAWQIKPLIPQGAWHEFLQACCYKFGAGFGSSIGDKAKEIYKMTEVTVEKVSDAFQGILKLVEAAALAICFANLASVCQTAAQWASLLGLILIPKFGQGLCTDFIGLFQRPTARADGDAIEPFVTVFLTLISVLFTGSISTGIVSNFFRVSDITGCKDLFKSGSKHAISLLSDLVISLLRFLVSYRSNETIQELLKNVDHAEADRLTIRDVPTLLIEMAQAVLICEQMNAEPRLYEHLSSYQELLARAFGTLKVLTHVREYPFSERVHFTAEYKKLYQAVMSAVNTRNAHSRVEPTVVYISGPAGIMKTRFAEMLAERVAERLWPAERKEGSYCYSRNPLQKHWDGYCNQPVCRFEEAFCSPSQKKDTTNEEHTAWLSLVSSAVYPLPMSTLSEKKTKFTSEVIICTSNIAFPESGTVDRAALLRRMQNHLLFCWKPGFPAQPVEDDENISSSGAMMDWSHLQIYAHKSGCAVNVPSGVTNRRYREVVTTAAPAPHLAGEFGQWDMTYLDVQTGTEKFMRDMYEAIDIDTVVERTVKSVERRRKIANTTAQACGLETLAIDNKPCYPGLNVPIPPILEHSVFRDSMFLPVGVGKPVDWHELNLKLDRPYYADGERLRGIKTLSELTSFNSRLLKNVFERRFGSSIALFNSWKSCDVDLSFDIPVDTNQENRDVVFYALCIAASYRSWRDRVMIPESEETSLSVLIARLASRGWQFQDDVLDVVWGPNVQGKIIAVNMKALHCMEHLLAPEDYRDLIEVRDQAGIRPWSTFWMNVAGWCCILFSFFLYFVFAYAVIYLVKSIFSAVLSIFLSDERIEVCAMSDVEHMLERRDFHNLKYGGEFDNGTFKYVDASGHAWKWDGTKRDWVQYEKSNKRGGKRQSNNRRIRGGARAHADDWISEMEREPTEGDMKLLDRFASQFVKITYIPDEGSEAQMYGIQITGQMLLVPRHLLRGHTIKSYRFKVETDTISFVEDVPVNHIHDFRGAKGVSGFDLANSDGLLIEFKNLKVQKSLLGHVCRETLQPANWFGKAPEVMALVPRINDSISGSARCTLAVPVGNLKKLGPVNYRDNQYADYTAQLYSTDVPDLTYGDCGSILLAREEGQLRIAGFYVAGDSNQGKNYFQPTTRSLLEAMTRNVVCHGFVSFPDVDPSKELSRKIVNPCPSLGRYLHADKPGVTCIPPSEIRPSPLQEENPRAFGHGIISAPAQLNIGSMQKAVDKKWHEPGFFETSILDRAVEWVKQDLSNHVQECAMISLQDSIDGNTRYGPGSRLAMDTSPGLPWSFQKEDPDAKGKSGLFEFTDGHYVPNEKLVSAVEEVVDCRRRGEIKPGLFRGTLKDERREVQRVLDGKTRIFTAGAVEKVIADRMLFLEFVVQFKEARLKLQHAYGVDPEGTEWHDMIMQHRAMGNHHFGFDYSGFDASESMQLLQSVSDCVASCYREEDRRHVVCSGVESFNHFVVIDGDVYHYHQGNPSGCTMTTIYNTIANWILLYYAWIKLSIANGVAVDRAVYTQNCVVHAYGDDFIASVSDKAEWFNGETIPPVLEVCGVKATAPDKTECKKFIPLDQLTFLCRYFVPNPFEGPKSMFVGPLPKELIEDIPMWYYKGADVCDYTSTIRTCVRSAALWGREYFEKYLLCLRKTKTGREFLDKLDVDSIFRDVSRPYRAGNEIYVQRVKEFFGPSIKDRVEISPEFNQHFKFANWDFTNFYAALGFEAAKLVGDENPARFCTYATRKAQFELSKLYSEMSFRWEEKTLFRAVYKIYEAKVQDASFKEALFATGDSVLVYWAKDGLLGAGIAPNNSPKMYASYPGKNVVGVVLMEMRRRFSLNN